MSKAQRVTGAAIAGLALGLIGVAIAAVPASAANPDVVYTSHIVNNAEDGTPPWARSTFDRTTTIHKNDDHTYNVTIKDSGTFTTTKDAKTLGNPDLKVIGVTSGAITGSWAYKVTVVPADVTTATEELSTKYDESFDYTPCAYKYDTNHGCATLPTTGKWPAHLFTVPVTVLPVGTWHWNYVTDCEKMENGSDVTKSGTVNNVKGNITGTKTCPKPTTEPTTAPIVLPKPSSSASNPVVAQPTLPITGNNVPVIAGTAGALILIGGAAYFGARRRKATN